MKSILIAAVAVAVSGAAFAKDLKGSVMSDSDMDSVTAGAGTPDPTQNGLFTACAAGSHAAVCGTLPFFPNPNPTAFEHALPGSGVATH